jgi:hypothetical protein
MPKRNALRDVDPKAITICKRGANRQRIFLRKAVPEADLLELVHETPLLKAADEWSAFYCVVAEPGAEEDPGLTGDRDSVDTWADEDEIRKAAHRLLKNGAYVNAQHDLPAEAGCSIVESAVALTDLELAEGASIKKGSWYVAIEPTDEFRKAVDAGEITGVSLEGTGLRVPLDKADPKAQGTKGQDRAHANTHRTCSNCGAKMALDASKCQSCGTTYVAKASDGVTNFLAVTPEHRKKINPIVEHYRKDPHPFTACVRDNTKRFGEERAKRICAVVKDMAEGTTHWRKGNSKLSKSDPGYVDEYTAAFVDAGIGTEPYDVELLEDYMTTARGLAKEAGSLGSNPYEEDDTMGLAEDFAALKKQQEELSGSIKKQGDVSEALVGLVGKLTERVEALGVAAGAGTAGKSSEEEDGKKGDVKKSGDVVEALGKLADRLDTFDSDLTALAKSVAKLGEGDSSQRGDDARSSVKKQNPLAGLLD